MEGGSGMSTRSPHLAERPQIFNMGGEGPPLGHTYPFLKAWVGTGKSSGAFDANMTEPCKGALLLPPPVRPTHATCAWGRHFRWGRPSPALLGDAYLFTFNNAQVVTKQKMGNRVSLLNRLY